MTIVSRRHFLLGAGGLALGTAGLGSYAFAIEPGLRLDVTSYNLIPPNWPADLKLKAAVIADIHACEPWMSVERIRSIVALANSLQPDITFVLGDFNAGHKMVTAPVYPEQWGEAIAALKAPLGTYAILGNHDWWHGVLPGMRGDDGESVRRALHHAGITLLENKAVEVRKDGKPLWVVGLGDQMAHRSGGYRHFKGVDDLDGALGQVHDDAPVLLLAHEPFIFHRVPARVALTLCGHTHGGQVNLPIISSAYAKSRYGTDHIYGHIVEDDRHMIISAGLGTSIAPVRFMRPPEVVEVSLGRTDVIAPAV